MNTKLYIDSEFVASASKGEVIDPSCAEVIAEVSVASAVEAEAALCAARRAADSGALSGLSLKERKGLLLKVSEGILERAGELSRLETLNTGKPIKETTFMDIPSSAETFRYFAEHLQEYLKEEGVALANARSRLVREPHGVAVLIVPWNYPLLIASWKLAQALAAGNCVVLKPSSLTPLSAFSLAEIFHSAGFPKGSVNIINGSGGEVGRALCRDSRVDMISFTGSNEVGRQILCDSAERVKKLLMELGGKSAAIVLKDADLELAVNGSLCSIFLNQGQMCTAMSRIFVQEDIYDSFVCDFAAKAKRIKLGKGLDYQTQMGPLISEAQRKKVASYVEKALCAGARLVCGGKPPVSLELAKGFFFEPTVFTGIPADSPLFREEVFGPVVLINRFSSVEEAVALANASDYGLACSIWSRDVAAAERLGCTLEAGTVWINTYGMFYNEVPYGGFKQSGFGKELGREGFFEYTRLKNIVTDATAGSKPLVNYWYGF